MKLRILLTLTLLILSSTALAQPNQAKLLGLKLTDTSLAEVRQHLANLGGFKRLDHLKRYHNQDKFYPITNQRHSYYYEFNYDANGELVNAKQLYRANARHLKNQARVLTTQEVAQELIKTLGNPQRIERKQMPGTPTYLTFSWEAEDIRIVLDKKNSDPYGPIVVEYQINKDPFTKRIIEEEFQQLN